MEENKNVNTPENDQAQNAMAEQKQPQARANRPAQAHPNANRQARPTSASSEDEKKKRAAAAPLSVSQQEQKKRATAAVVPKKNKLTRKSFGRKVVIAGVALFMSIALIATGFAAWVIATDAKVDGSVGVEVGTVTDAGMEIKLDGTVAKPLEDGSGYDLYEDIKFEPKANTNGTVRWDSSKPEEVENLDIEIFGTVSNAQMLSKQAGGISIAITLPETIVDAFSAGTIKFTPEGSNEAITLKREAGYIYMQDYVDAVAAKRATTNSDGSVTITVPLANSGDSEAENSFWIVETESDGVTTYTGHFKYTLSFTWGEYFKNVNPCYYYDGTDGTKAFYTETETDTDVMTKEQYDALLAKEQDAIVKEMKALYHLLSGKATELVQNGDTTIEEPYSSSSATSISLTIMANAA